MSGTVNETKNRKPFVLKSIENFFADDEDDVLEEEEEETDEEEEVPPLEYTCEICEKSYTSEVDLEICKECYDREVCALYV